MLSLARINQQSKERKALSLELNAMHIPAVTN
jgi:hypothetical protein